MGGRFGRAVLLWGLVLLASSSRAAEEHTAASRPDTTQWQSWRDLARASEQFVLRPGQRRVDLAQPRVSELTSVRLGRRVLVEVVDFRLIPEQGLLVLRRAAAAEDTLRVEYRFRPEGLPSQLVLHDATRSLEFAVGDTARSTAGAIPAGRAVDARAALGDLRIRGSKTVSIRGGTNRDATVDQGLDLSVTGRLTEGIGVRAEITDENLPITPEGNTEELSDLDEVRIELFGDRGRALLGDFRIDRPLGAFLPYERKLQGLWLQGKHSRGSLQVLGGAPQGKRIEVELRGAEGIQGPYELLDGLRLSETFVVAGSERVWLDGELLTRGDSRDYVIDYVRGTVTFNETRPIGPESRIAVDFESSVAGYRRGVLGALVDSLRVGKLRVDAAVLREGDDPDRPLDFTLGADERAALAAAGDDENGALSSGVTPTDPGEGDYSQRVDAQGNLYYELADSTGGDFDLDFVFVGAGQGDYRLEGVSETGVRRFVFVGANQGDYRVGRQLDLPERREVASVRIGFGDPTRGGGVAAEWNATRFDANRLSSIDDEDNQGSAVRLRAGTPWWRGSSEESGWRARALYERVERDFVSSGRLREPFFYDVWNLQAQERDRDEEFLEAGAEWRDHQRSIEVRLRRLERLGQYTGTRWELPGSGRVVGPLAWEHFYAETRADRTGFGKSTRQDRRLRLLADSRRWRPFVEARDEEYRDPGATRWEGYRSGGWSAGVREGGNLLEFRRDVGDSLTSDGARWRFVRDVRQWRGTVGTEWKSGRLQSDVTWRVSRLEDDARERTRLGRVQFAHRFPSRGLGVDLDYRAGTDRSRVLGRRVVFVGLGDGDYDAEGNPVGPKQGDYNIVFTPSDSLVSATDVEANLQVSLESDLSWVGGLESRTLVQIREKSRSDEVAKLLRLAPSVLRDPETTLFGQQRVREEVHLLRTRRGIDLRLAHDATDVLDQRFTEGPEKSARRESGANLEVGLGAGWSVAARVARESRERRTTSVLNPQLRSYDVVDRIASMTLRLRPNPRRRYALELRATRRVEHLVDLQQTLLEARPSATTDWFGLSWTLEGRWSQLDESGPSNPQRPFFFERPGATRSAGVRMQWASASGFSVSLRYQLLDEAQRLLRHDLGLETRARF